MADTGKYAVLHISGHIVEKELVKFRVPPGTSVPNSGLALAKKLRFSDFHIQTHGDPFLHDKGCSVFLGQTVLPDVMVVAVYSAKGLPPEFYFPANPAATKILRNPALKVYGGAILVRSDQDGGFLPVPAAEFRSLATSRSLYTPPEDDGAPVRPFCARKRPEERPQEGRASADRDWRGLRREEPKKEEVKKPELKEKETADSAAASSAGDSGTTTAAAASDVTGEATPLATTESPFSATALWDFTAATRHEISVAAGDELCVLARGVDDAGEWSYGRLDGSARAGSVGYFPDQILTTFPKPWAATCTTAYSAERGGFLALEVGASVEVLYFDPASGDYFGRLPGGASGWFPKGRVA